VVAENGGRIALSDWLARERGTLAGCARLSPRIVRLRRDESSPFDFTMKEFQERALPIYDGTLHSWPQHDAVKEAFSSWPEERQIDFVHSYLEYFSINGSDADGPIVEWVRSRRRFRFLFVAETRAQNPADSADGLAEELRLAALQLIELGLERVAERRVSTPDLARRFPDPRERYRQSIRLDPQKAEKFVNIGVADEIAHLHEIEEFFPSASARRPPDPLTDPKTPWRVGLPEALSRLGEPDSRAEEIRLAQRSLELHWQWENYGRGRAEYEANRLPQFEIAVNALRRAAENYLARAW
jgi:hypothetical protein